MFDYYHHHRSSAWDVRFIFISVFSCSLAVPLSFNWTICSGENIYNYKCEMREREEEKRKRTRRAVKSPIQNVFRIFTINTWCETIAAAAAARFVHARSARNERKKWSNFCFVWHSLLFAIWNIFKLKIMKYRPSVIRKKTTSGGGVNDDDNNGCTR